MFYCKAKCCTIQVNKYERENKVYKSRSINRKAGVFIYDPIEEKVLLVQSCGRLWGCPKGSVENGESVMECAIREVKEETGIQLDTSNLQNSVILRPRSAYFYSEIKECPVTVQDIPGNDANGITWIKIDCLKQCIQNGNISLNHPTKILLWKFLRIKIPKSEFTTVVSRKTKRQNRRRKTC